VEFQENYKNVQKDIKNKSEENKIIFMNNFNQSLNEFIKFSQKQKESKFHF
jgi:hypothetical protein